MTLFRLQNKIESYQPYLREFNIGKKTFLELLYPVASIKLQRKVSANSLNLKRKW